jgi:tripartite-type tricarboxylate transporter receptor subunit TctC
MISRRAILATSAMLLSLGAVAPVVAQTPWPGAQPIKFIVPFAAGSATDTVARVYGDQMSRALGATIVIENRAGANGLIGADAVAKAAPDGYTILIGTNSTNAAAPALFNRVPFDHQKDFAPVSFLGSVPLIVGVPASSPMRTLKDLIDTAKAKPGVLNFATASSSQRVSTEMLATMAGIKMNMVPYRASPQAATDLMAGRIDLFVADMALMLPHVQAGSIRALAVTSASRVSQLPDTPTVDQAGGFNGYELIAWFGAFAPTGTPQPIVDRLNAAARQAAASADVLEKLGKGMGMTIAASTPAELAERVKVESVKWEKAVSEAGIEKQ